ncbi:MAG: phosphatidylserine/phosphatidylglycerophosphate/cardiolipin synthase family protein [Candidatus Gastranaerophilales bacterium]
MNKKITIFIIIFAFCLFIVFDNWHAISLKKEIENGISAEHLDYERYVKLFFTDFTKTLKFSNDTCDSEICLEFLDRINSAENSIDIAAYSWSKNVILETALKNAKARGVRIRLVYDETKSGNKFKYGFKNLVDIVEVSQSDRSIKPSETAKLMHNKFVIFDENITMTGSMNFTGTGLSGFNSNVVIFVKSSEIASQYKKEFEQMLDGKFHSRKIEFVPQTVRFDGLSITPLFSPKNKIVSRYYLSLIGEAKNYIYLPTFIITHNDVVEALIDAVNRGVDVKMVIDATSAINFEDKIIKLRENGVIVKSENYAGKMHSKILIIDDNVVAIGSMNLSYSGENLNDENILIIENEDIAKRVKRYFEYTYDSIAEIYSTVNVRAESFNSIGSCEDGIDNNYDRKIDKEDVACSVHEYSDVK